MNIVMITEKDAANTSLACIANKFYEHGDAVAVFAPFYNEQVLRWFDRRINIYHIEQLTKEFIDSCDFVFCSCLSSIYLPIYVFSAKKPIFTHNYLMNRQISWGGDVCFVPSVATTASDYDGYLTYSYIGIGDPKYDNQTSIVTKNKRFLFIDSGHYPFSVEGKRELSKTLLHICDKYPDYELWIKPRFLPGDRVVTHKNNIYLYDVIMDEAKGKIPSNLVMMNYHEDLMKLINESTTIICMYTTAYVGAIVAGKGLIVLENLKSTDIYDIRENTYMRNRENMIGSGALVDYKDVDKLLPDGIKSDERYLNYLLEERSNVAEKICETCTWMVDHFYSQNRFPVQFNSTYKEYMDVVEADANMTWEKYISRRYHDYILFKSLILIDFHVKSKLDIAYILNRAKAYNGDDGIIRESEFEKFLSEANSIRDNCLIQNASTLLEDRIDAGILLNALYLRKEYQKVKEFTIKDIAAYDYYRALVALEEGTKEETEFAEAALRRYFFKVSNRQFCLEISDMSNNRFSAFEKLIRILLEKNSDDFDYYVKLLENYYKEVYFVEDLQVEPEDELQKQRYNFLIEVQKRSGHNEQDKVCSIGC